MRTFRGYAMANVGCACGTEVKPGEPFLTWLDRQALNAFIDVDSPEWSPLVQQLIGQPMDWSDLCSQPPPTPPTWAWEDFLPANWASTWQKLNTQAAATVWNAHCQCVDCPPASTCGDGTTFTVEESDGTYYPNADPSPVYIYVIPTGDFFVQIGASACYTKSGLWIEHWPANPAIPHGLVKMCDGDGTNCTSADPTIYGTSVIVTTNGASAAPSYPWPDPPPEIGTYGDPPTCDPTTVCTALSYVTDAITQVQRTLNSMLSYAGPTAGDVSVAIPGDPTTLTGTIAQILGPALTALLPPQLAQLDAPTVTPLTESGSVSVSAKFAARIELTSIPPWIGSRGAEAVVQLTKTGSPSAGWVLVVGDGNVLEYHDLRYPDGQWILLPPMADTLLIELQAGVEIAVTTYNRSVA